MMSSRQALWGSTLLVLCGAGVTLGLWNASRLGGVGAELHARRSDVRRLEGSLSSLATRMEGLQAGIERIHSRLSAIEDRAAGEKRDAQVRPERRASVGSELEELREELNELRAALERLRADPQLPGIAGDKIPIEGDVYLPPRAEPPVTDSGSNAGAVRWDVAQLLGAPDTFADGDSPTAWAAKAADGGLQWVEVEFDVGPAAQSVMIRETFNPGGVMKVEAQDPAGNFRVLWVGEDPTDASPGELYVDLDAATSGTEVVRITIDTDAVTGWEEIDAVGLVTAEGIRWAIAARASSSYSEVYAAGGTTLGELPAETR